MPGTLTLTSDLWYSLQDWLVEFSSDEHRVSLNRQEDSFSYTSTTTNFFDRTFSQSTVTFYGDDLYTGGNVTEIHFTNPRSFQNSAYVIDGILIPASEIRALLDDFQVGDPDVLSAINTFFLSLISDIRASEGNDIIDAIESVRSYNLRAGADRLEVTADTISNDITVNGGQGDDTIALNDLRDVNFNMATQVLVHNGGRIQIANVENIELTDFSDTVFGSNRADTITGRGGADLLSGRDGNDTFQPGAGRDSVKGGAGRDTVSYLEFFLGADTRGIIVDLQKAKGLAGEAKGDTYQSIENVIGTIINDDIYGNSGANHLFGHRG